MSVCLNQALVEVQRCCNSLEMLLLRCCSIFALQPALELHHMKCLALWSFSHAAGTFSYLRQTSELSPDNEFQAAIS